MFKKTIEGIKFNYDQSIAIPTSNLFSSISKSLKTYRQYHNYRSFVDSMSFKREKLTKVSRRINDRYSRLQIASVVAVSTAFLGGTTAVLVTGHGGDAVDFVVETATGNNISVIAHDDKANLPNRTTTSVTEVPQTTIVELIPVEENTPLQEIMSTPTTVIKGQTYRVVTSIASAPANRPISAIDSPTAIDPTPGYQAPSTETPTTINEPDAPATTKAPATTSPRTTTTRVPTTLAPTTQAPTTLAPPTVAPTTEAPITIPATTEAPPTTEAPVTTVTVAGLNLSLVFHG